MLAGADLQLLNRCAGYLHELAEIYRSGGTNNSYILTDLREIERRTLQAVRVARSPKIGRRRAGWRDDVTQVLAMLGRPAHLSEIELLVRELRKNAGRSWPKNADACIRDTLDVHCSESLKFRAGPNLFRMVDRGSGFWALREVD
jgi:hypothetical protein